MKKIIALVAVVAFASCTSEPASTEAQTCDSTAVVTDSTKVDSTSTDTVTVSAQ